MARGFFIALPIKGNHKIGSSTQGMKHLLKLSVGIGVVNGRQTVEIGRLQERDFIRGVWAMSVNLPCLPGFICGLGYPKTNNFKRLELLRKGIMRGLLARNP
jgi:hypothetical protein